MTTAVVTSLAAVVVLAQIVYAKSVPSSPASAYYYEPIVPYGPYPAPGYIVSAYLPKYTGYQITPVPYLPRKTEYSEDKYEEEEPKYYYGGKFRGKQYD